ncbi:hypothetical protein QCA50_007852 [Cerrena zonata]|uniref:Aminoglycoside phosphotransferase domain-containing protein n=1 Tax=Cerrena zonata TaxID=2478898 RepID=A0AAW0GI77_9APHY
MQNIRIALIGGVGSGKCSLKQALERDSFVRREDHGKFSFQANVFSTAPANLSLDYDMTLVLFGLMEQYSPDLRQNLEAAVDLASELQTMYKINERVSLVATKYDLVPRQWSGVDLYLAREENQLVYPDDISLHKVSSITREGIDDLRDHIANVVFPIPPVPGRMPGISKYILTQLLDTAAYIFSLPIPSNVNQDTPDPLLPVDENAISDEAEQECLARIQANDTTVYQSQVRMVTATLVAKSPTPYERYNMEFVRKHTTIPVPQPRYRHFESWLLMDRIEGRTLEDCWNSLSFFMQFRIACTMRCYMKQLRGLTGTAPGNPDRCIGGNIFECNEWGPFNNARQFRRFCEASARSQWIARTIQYTQNRAVAQPPPPVISPEDWSLSFAHGDIHMGNLMLSKDSVLWMVDWGSSGYYPSWMETAYIDTISNTHPKSWNRWKWFIAGRDPNYVRQFWSYTLTVLACRGS